MKAKTRLRKDYCEDLPKSLREIRQWRELSVRAMAAYVGLDQATYFRIETGKGGLNKQHLAHLIIRLQEIGYPLTAEQLLFPEGYQNYLDSLKTA